ncbi:lysin A [Mycobacterium Phage Rachaly]|nr:lysin A [Mycobacterium Phage Rachaly]
MSRRLFRGRQFSENGWPYVDQGSCEWFDVAPGVTMQIQQGPPFTILGAFARDYHAYVEPIFDPDCCCWTQDNSVDTSNHPGGTACDIRWNKHPFQVRGTFTREQLATIQELLDFYEGTVFWAGVDWKEGGWGSPIDEMHWQMGYNTYDQKADRPTDRVFDFIKRKIRPDGFSTFRRSGGTPAPAPASEMTVPLTDLGNGRWTSPSLAWAHLIMRESSGNPTIIQQIHDVNSGGNEAEGLFQITPRTWKAHNGTQFAPSARFATPQQQAIVAARIITRNPSGSDWGAGLPGREDARQLVAGLVPTQTQGDDDELADPVIQKMIREIHACLFNTVVSQSPYRFPRNPDGSEPRENLWQLHELIKNGDGMTHMEYVEDAARHGDLNELGRVVRAARGQGAETAPWFVQRAQRVIAEIEKNDPDLLKRYIAERGGL